MLEEGHADEAVGKATVGEVAAHEYDELSTIHTNIQAVQRPYKVQTSRHWEEGGKERTVQRDERMDLISTAKKRGRSS